MTQDRFEELLDDTDETRVTHYVNGEPTERQRLKRFAGGMLKIGNATIGNWSKERVLLSAA